MSSVFLLLNTKCDLNSEKVAKYRMSEGSVFEI